MKKFAWRITICLLPLILGTIVVVNAFQSYYAGKGGFRLGVDLVGGTILIYEVDVSKFPEGKLPVDWKPEELARRLKSRIDPNDLYNITVRVAGNTRFEIILPTGGAYQVQAEEAAWQKVLELVQEKYPADKYEVPAGHETELLAEIHSQYPDRSIQEIREFVEAGMKKYRDARADEKAKVWDALLASATEKYKPKGYEVGRGKTGELIAEVATLHPKVPLNEITELVRPDDPSARRSRGSLTTEKVQEFKELVTQVGSLEFRIPANMTNDADAIAAAKRYIAAAKDNPAIRKDLEEAALFGKPPPPPTTQGDGRGNVKFDTPLGQFSYSWVELSSDFRHQYGLANPRHPDGTLWMDAKPEDFPGATLPGSDSPYRMFWRVKADRDAGIASDLPYEQSRSLLLYSREVRNTRLPEKDREKQVEYFMLMRDPESPDQKITGEYLASVRPENGEIHFNMKPPGTELFYELTRANKNQAMAIVLDGFVESTATIQSAIRGSGRITGNFTTEKVDRTVQVLRSGALPGTLKREPVSESSMGPTLGADTITMGFYSIIGAFLAVLGFMCIWYFFSGFVACIALFANLLLTVAFMVMIDAAFTLPGLAGLVLTLGMAVDANVLIYERIREERKRGMDLKRSIANGYDHALPAIIDTHLTSIFTAIVLYIVGNDQLKGFGISLAVGLIISLFTSLYITRLIFDLGVESGWIKRLLMPFDPFSGFKINFMSIRWVVLSITVGLTIAGGALFMARLDHGMLNIDFVKGTAYTGELVEPVTISELETALQKADLPDISIEQMFISAPGYTEGRASRLFTVRTTETDVRDVTRKINEAIGTGEGKVQLKKIGISDQVEYLPSKEAIKTVALSFVDPQKPGEPVFASRAQVVFQLNETLRKMIEEREEKAADTAATDEQKQKLDADILALRNLAQGYSVVGLGQEQDGHFQFVEIQFVDTVKPEQVGLLTTAIAQMKHSFEQTPLPERLENFDPQLAQETQLRAIYAVVASWGAILLYLWFRFGSWTFGLAAVLCLVHDLFFALGIIAACHYVYNTWFGQFLLLNDFKIDLAAVAALLTLVGYSVNDTIIVFDRIREVRGKNPALTEQMINASVNQTLSRTILASFTTFLVVIVLYILGGEGVHLFAFIMVIGIFIGTYSSIYVASPLLLIFGEGQIAPAASTRQTTQPAGTSA